ncbi:MAG: AAA family ATPase [Nitrospinales bacterium]
MARADLLIKLVRSGSAGDTSTFKKTVEAVIAEERSKQHHVLAERLGENLRPNGSDSFKNNKDDPARNLFLEIFPSRRMEDLVLPNAAENACRELIEEQLRSDLLRAHALEPRHKVLLAGPPGNGKTSLAEAIAEALAIPLISIRYETLIGSFLGETAARLQRVFDYVRTRPCVLFFDEFDTIGKERGDTHETGEIKRVVSSLLLQMDSLPSYVIVITASNHPELLDRAVWRRFQLRIELPQPDFKQLSAWFEKFSKKFDQPLGHTPKTLAQKLIGISFAEAEEFCADILRRYALTHEQQNVKKIVSSCLAQWQARYSVKD